LAGDVDFDCAKSKLDHAGSGGVGPMTRAMLMKNTIIAYKTSVYND
jgi:methylenetetrahydrofolate dehydrogenase (NADP+)/methenyltetrahydrofolate cyclohydrolase